jgi:hypothetical protein
MNILRSDGCRLAFRQAERVSTKAKELSVKSGNAMVPTVFGVYYSVRKSRGFPNRWQALPSKSTQPPHGR